MSKQKDSEDLVRVGPGTVMGEMMRQYWLPAAMSSELERDAAPMRLMLLGERLIAFRDSSGRVGVMDHRCPHRCASLFLGRNEEDGIRCVYHGWKYDVDGQLRRHAEHPAETGLQGTRSRPRPTRSPSATASSGSIWATAAKAPPLPGIEASLLPAGRVADHFRAARVQLAAGARRRHRHLAFRLSACRLGRSGGCRRPTI